MDILHQIVLMVVQMIEAEVEEAEEEVTEVEDMETDRDLDPDQNLKIKEILGTEIAQIIMQEEEDGVLPIKAMAGVIMLVQPQLKVLVVAGVLVMLKPRTNNKKVVEDRMEVGVALIHLQQICNLLLVPAEDGVILILITLIINLEVDGDFSLLHFLKIILYKMFFNLYRHIFNFFFFLNLCMKSNILLSFLNDCILICCRIFIFLQIHLSFIKCVMFYYNKKKM